MARKGGNPSWKGNKNSGRKKISEEILKKASIMMIKEIAKDKTLRALNVVDSVEEVKDIALPIVLKTMTEKKDITSGGKPINFYDDQQLESIARRIVSDGKAKKPEISY